MKIFISTIIICLCFSCNNGKAPEPYGPLPSQGQLNWHALETYAFVHFNMNTFSGQEWGMGNEDPALFNPTDLDCRQWVDVLKKAGMKAVIITAKHHDGFCLWPTSTTEHSVKHSPWKDGKGDVIRELSDACREAGLKFGVYLSPWDRNNAYYGKPEYIAIFRTQLKELLTRYGDIFEVWFDGANGGNGYYGGANETRSVDRQTYYDWPATFALVHELQPNAVIFSDAGPDVRWVGNESGFAGRTNWALLRRDEFWPGTPLYQQLTEGHEDGTHWLPAEVDVSIRPGWYYHASQDNQVKTLPQLLDIYYNSVGRNAGMLLNVPADTRGRFAETDIEALWAFKSAIDSDMRTDLAGQALVTANCDRGNAYNALKVIDNDNTTYWGTPDSIRQGTLTFRFREPVSINRILLQEPVALGQRIQQFKVEAQTDGQWQTIAEETTIGYKRILRTADFTTSEIRICIEKSKACPLISTIAFYQAPEILTAPEISRSQDGFVTLSSTDKNVEIHYTTDGTRPDSLSTLYTGPFPAEKMTVKAIAADRLNKRAGPVATMNFDLAKKDWTCVSTPGNTTAIDDNIATSYRLATRRLPAELIIDLNGEYDLNGFTYLPEQNNSENCPVMEYEFYVSKDGKNWGSPVSTGEFSNIVNSPIRQEKHFRTNKGRYIKFKVITVNNRASESGIAEIGVITL